MPIPNSSLQRTAKVSVVQRQLAQIDARVAAGQMTTEAAREEKNQLTERKWQLNIKMLILAILAVAVVTAILRSLSESTRFLWLIAIPPLPQEVGDMATVLAPLVAVSVTIERLLETVFDWFEQSTRSAADVLAAPKEALDWIGREYKEAYEATTAAAEATGVTMTPTSAKALDAAEERLARAEARLRGWTNAPEYKAWKRALSIWVGLLVGLVVAIVGDLGMFHAIGIPMPRFLDMLVTGLIIGAGPGPMHSIIGILQSSKDAVNNLAELAKGKAVRDAAQALLIQANAKK